MAASVLRRCLSAAIKVKHSSPSFSARRWLLSSAYSDTSLWEAREKDPQNLALLANNMDRIYERNLPVSSLTVSQFVDNISCREEVDQAEYYLYKFRHSPNCWYLRDWTIHSWIRQCLKYGAREKALHTLKNKVQYGIFPDNFTCNLLINSYLKDEDFESASFVVEEVMLQEAFDLPSTQILSLYTLASYLATRPKLTVSQQRALGASLLICGLKQDNSVGLTAMLLGNALLGKVEMDKGIHAVFKGMPLFWERGYISRALAVMESVVTSRADIKLSKDSLAFLGDVLHRLSSTTSDLSGEESAVGQESKEEIDEDDQAEREKLSEYESKFKVTVSQLEAQGKVDASDFRTLATSLAQQQLPSVERPDLDHYATLLEAWEVERKQLIQREQEARRKAEEEKQQRLAAKAALQQQA
ncbi:28S ribosomal protein S27, mitochondrial [Corythoichthys intestinalis]|uniref:28S ribosomal protein S27, mitochondrial n=1 Tax=Corythoichthys intestinalis TaxID=161448 RepID=UPI0025A4F8CD|nr:28S ribosomal protein S27, mitochondrial [Corythoichthys intestinalis]XP_057688982.1 28S ribosomal protein S27, mitochondrial [Corythoichthys intestinalis]XP_061804731.1 small ribosomal subunit protein mS27-like [Nerophis lumbriciformis]